MLCTSTCFFTYLPLKMSRNFYKLCKPLGIFDAFVLFPRMPVEDEVTSSSPVDIPVATVLANNEGGYFGLCQSLDSPVSSCDAELFDSMAASKFIKEYVNFNNEPQHTGLLNIYLFIS